jgi:hypothetical protein
MSKRKSVFAALNENIAEAVEQMKDLNAILADITSELSQSREQQKQFFTYLQEKGLITRGR